MPVHILARQGMHAIASSYGFKKGTSAFYKGISTFSKSTNNLGKKENHLATPLCSSFLDVSIKIIFLEF